eukprot:PITA_24345
MVVYLADILIFNQIWEEHLHHIQDIVQTLRQHKLCVNLEKSTFGMTHVQYLGYITNEKGVHVDPTKIQVIQDWQELTTLTQLCNFLGLANFYYRFVLGFSHITWPLSQVTKGMKAKLFWLENQQKAFVEFKHHLCSTPISHYETCNNHLRLRHMPPTMLLVQFLLSRDIQWLTTVRHFQTQRKTSGWPHIYKSDPEFDSTYQTLLEGKQVPKFQLQDALLCHLGHICVPSSERDKMIWEVHCSRVAGHFRVEKIVAVLQEYFYWPNLRQDVGKYI